MVSVSKDVVKKFPFLFVNRLGSPQSKETDSGVLVHGFWGSRLSFVFNAPNLGPAKHMAVSAIHSRSPIA